MYDKTNLKMANYFIEKDIDVYFYPKMTHVKAAVYDNWACLGSANFNKLSLFKNREINVAFYDEKTVNKLIKDLFMKDFEVSDKFEEPVDIPFIYYLMQKGWKNPEDFCCGKEENKFSGLGFAEKKF